MPAHHTHQQFLIGQLTFDSGSRELCSATERLYLEPQAYQLLSLFIAAAQGQLSRDQMIEQLWDGRVVSESAINRAVSLLRKALSQLDASQPYLETLPKVGYRLLVPVTRVPAVAEPVTEPVLKPFAEHSAELSAEPTSAPVMGAEPEGVITAAQQTAAGIRMQPEPITRHHNLLQRSGWWLPLYPSW